MGRGIGRHNTVAAVSGVLNFLNREVTIGFPPEWNSPGPSKLWLYNLHYFEYIWGLAPADATRVALDWMARHPYGRDQIGWEPYPLSLRLQNWCGYFLGRHKDFTESDGAFLDTLVRSIAVQAEVLEKNLELHLLGNHLLENAATLALVGTCLAGPSAERQRTRGLRLLDEQLREQVLPDGGHFERSPMYQSRLTYVLSQVIASGDDDLPGRVGEAHRTMQTALALETHPDGEIALFNDAAFQIAPIPAEMGVRPALPGKFALPQSGYFGARTRRGDFVICDAGPIGPDYIPGHAHGDMFSFELSLAGARVIVDSGVFGYEPDAMRAYCRSTKAHNTVEIGGVDQSEFWGTFRVARRAHPQNVTFEKTTDGFRLSGEHDGYSRLPGRPVHRRRFRWFDDGIFIVSDQVSSSRPVSCVSRLHLHPDCEIVELDKFRARIRHAAGECVVAWTGEGTLGTEDSWYCPEFGLRRKNVALAFTVTSPQQCSFCIAPDDSRVSFEL